MKKLRNWWGWFRFMLALAFSATACGGATDAPAMASDAGNPCATPCNMPDRANCPDAVCEMSDAGGWRCVTAAGTWILGQDGKAQSLYRSDDGAPICKVSP